MAENSVIPEAGRNPDITNIESTLNEDSRNSETVHEDNRTVVIDEFNNSNARNEESRICVRVNNEPRKHARVKKSKSSDKNNDGPPAKIRKLNTANQDYDTCPICLDLWGNAGDHRLVALKCGHLFGERCIERWLKAQRVRNRTCPTCKSKALLRDIRHIYANKLVAADTNEITEYQKQLAILQAEKTKSDLEMENARIDNRNFVIQLKELGHRHFTLPLERTIKFSLDKIVEINRNRGCRALTYNCRTYELYVAMRNTNDLFPSFGISNVSCFNYTLGEFLHLHSEPIQDITYSQRKDLLLSVSYDNTARLVDRGILSHTIQCGMSLCSCSWDYFRMNEFYVGGREGQIHRYDIRNPGMHMDLQLFNSIGDDSPVVSLVSTEHGLLSCQLYTCCLGTYNRKQWEYKKFPVEGPFTSLCYDNETNKVLVSCSLNHNKCSKFTLCNVNESNNSGRSSDVVMEYEETYPGIARRNAFTKVLGEKWIAAYSSSDSSLNLYGVDDSRKVCLPLSEQAMDICACISDVDMFAVLTDSRLRLYKATSPMSSSSFSWQMGSET